MKEMPVDIFGSDGKTSKADVQLYIKSKFFTITKNLQTKLDKNITEDFNMNGHRITHVTNPVEKLDVANENYVNSVVSRNVNAKSFYTLSTNRLVPHLLSADDETG